VLKFYPDRPGRRFAYLLLDLMVVVWAAVWVAAGLAVYRLITGLWVVSDAIGGTGRTFNEWIGDFRRVLSGNIPILGRYLSTTADALQKHTGDPLIQTAAQAHDSIQQFAVGLGILTAAPPILIVGGLYLIRRWRQAREMGAALAFVRAAEQGGTLEQARALLAFRAVATLPFRRLMRASRDPVGDLGARRYDELAAEMLRSAGLESYRLYRRWPGQLGEAPAQSNPPALDRRPARRLEAASPAEVGDYGQSQHQ
jgi:hypothetical protein